MAPRWGARKLSRAAVVVGLLLGASTGAAAQPDSEADESADVAEAKTSSLSWVRLDGGEGCIAASALAAAVEERLGRKVFVSTADADLNIEGSVGPRAEGGFSATLRVTDREGAVLGRRDVSVDGPCSDLDAKLGLVISVMIDPNASLTPPTPDPEPAVKPPPVVPDPPEPKIIEKEKIVVVPAPTSPPVRWEVGASLLTGLGLQPGVGIGFAPSFVVEFDETFALVVEGGVTAPTEASAGADDDPTASVMVVHGGVGICPLTLHPWRLSLLACAGWFAGATLSEGDGLTVARSGVAVVTGPWLETRATWMIVEPLGLTSSLGLFVPITRAEVFYRAGPEEVTLFETAPIGGMADLGLTIGLP